MGAWGIKAYENDGAGDFYTDLAETDDPIAFLSSAFVDLDDEYIEVDQGQAVVMSAAIILYWSGGTSDHVGDDAKERIVKKQQPIPQSLVKSALTALKLVVSDANSSESYELWEEGEDFENWRKEVTSLSNQLSDLA